MGAVSVQIIGYNTHNGATCFFESPDAIGDNIQSQYLSYDDNGFLDGTLPLLAQMNLIKYFIHLQFQILIVCLVIPVILSYMILG